MTATLPPPTKARDVRPLRPRLSRAPRVAARQPRPPRRTRSSAVNEPAVLLTTSLGMLALVSLWLVAQMLVLGTLSQTRAQQLLYDEFRGQLASATAPVGPVVEPGAPVALISAPAIGLQQVVVEGTASGDTLTGPGHLRNTPLPGQSGTAVVYGRARTYGGPFRRITELRTGDLISVVNAQGATSFHVLGVRRAGDPLPQPLTAGHARLTLVTAEGSGRLAALRPSRAVFVDAEATTGYPAPAGLPAAVPDSERVMAGDRQAMSLLVLCLASLILLTIGVVAARQHWSAALVWVVATPLAIALSWLSTDVVMRLLPNLI